VKKVVAIFKMDLFRKWQPSSGFNMGNLGMTFAIFEDLVDVLLPTSRVALRGVPMTSLARYLLSKQ